MPSKSEKQANLFKAALGKHPTGAAAKIKKTLSKKKIKEFTHTESLFNSLVDSLLSEKTKKDSCYYSVKSRFKKKKAWPSMYAGAALARCRKK